MQETWHGTKHQKEGTHGETTGVMMSCSETCTSPQNWVSDILAQEGRETINEISVLVLL